MVWPAYNEAYGMALLEAAATGLPAVAGRWRGVPEIVADGETGLLSEPRDDIGFAEAVVVLSGDTERRQAMGRAASARVTARHSLAAAIKVLRPALDEARRIRTIEP
jgi:glycosyltransferase involved in cell wall biosynthesis